MKIGIITYNYNHLKTERMVIEYNQSVLIDEIHLYALPFIPQPQEIIFNHRPSMSDGVLVSDLQRLKKFSFKHGMVAQISKTNANYT